MGEGVMSQAGAEVLVSGLGIQISDRRPPFIKAPDGSKPCPFCGGTDLVLWREPCTFMSDYVCMRCETCHAQGPTKGFDDEWEHEFTWNHREGAL